MRLLCSLSLVCGSLALMIGPTQAQLQSLAQPPQAQIEFSCQQIPDRDPAAYETLVKLTTPNGNFIEKTLVRWELPFPGEWTPQKRCEAVTERFQNLSDSGHLRYLTLGTLNQETVICGQENPQEICTSDNLLLTLRREDKPNADLILNNLFEIRVGRSNEPLVHGYEDASSLEKPSCAGGTKADWEGQTTILCLGHSLDELAQQLIDENVPTVDTVQTQDASTELIDIDPEPLQNKELEVRPSQPTSECQTYDQFTGECLDS